MQKKHKWKKNKKNIYEKKYIWKNKMKMKK